MISFGGLERVCNAAGYRSVVTLIMRHLLSSSSRRVCTWGRISRPFGDWISCGITRSTRSSLETRFPVIPYIYENKPKESMLTSFSVLFAAYKGDLSYYIEGAKAIDSLKETSHVLIAECCTHAPLKEDIGRVKIPRMLKKRFGENLQVELVSGTDFPDDLTGYDLIIQCGACMFNRKYVMYRIDRAKKQQVPVTNYGITIAHLTGILDHVALPE